MSYSMSIRCPIPHAARWPLASHCHLVFAQLELQEDQAFDPPDRNICSMKWQPNNRCTAARHQIFKTRPNSQGKQSAFSQNAIRLKVNKWVEQAELYEFVITQYVPFMHRRNVTHPSPRFAERKHKLSCSQPSHEILKYHWHNSTNPPLLYVAAKKYATLRSRPKFSSANRTNKKCIL